MAMKLIFRIFLTLSGLFASAHGLFLGGAINAYRLPTGKTITMDGRPDTVWKVIAGMGAGTGLTTIAFNDYAKIVLLDSVGLRNDDPSQHYTAPATGSVGLLAAYDNTALYFFFLVKENTTFDGRTLCDSAKLWKANAAEVFVDPSAWNTSLYQSYFSVDAGSQAFGTSPKTALLGRSAFVQDNRAYYRSRAANDRFDLRAAPSGTLVSASAHNTGDPMTIGVEMKMPFASIWGGATAFAPGNSMFISWGYNHYPSGAPNSCNNTPIAYRWAKHYKTYGPADDKPPGWILNDTTHYDPLRSWDGWGRLTLNIDSAKATCSQLDTTSWDPAYWNQHCPPIAVFSKDSPRKAALAPGRSSPGEGSMRDAQGRRSRARSRILYLLPYLSPAARALIRLP